MLCSSGSVALEVAFSLPVRAEVEEIFFTALRFSVSAPQQNKECYYSEGNNRVKSTKAGVYPIAPC